jgi:hypothetical protein
LTNFVYDTGPLGRFYQHSTNLIDAGYRTASFWGLYHFTTVTNQSKEADSTNDIGYHYVAVDGNGNPIDSDEDGLSDYFEDANGNGVYGISDFANWTSIDTDSDGTPDGWEVSLGLNPLVNDNAQPGTRANYTYGSAYWLEGISGTGTGSVSLDNEGNVLSVSQ